MNMADTPDGSNAGALLAPLIDHTLLKPDATVTQIRQLCEEALQFHFASVCVNPVHIRLVADELAGSAVTPCTVIGFPLGASTSTTKAFETEEAVRNGAREIDMVMAIGLLKSNDRARVLADMRTVVRAAGKHLVKVILETCLLTREEKVTACKLAKEAGARFVKTSTGFSTGGATVDDVQLMRQTVGQELGVKASGGIRTRQDAALMVAAGATRIGTSAGVSIVSG